MPCVTRPGTAQPLKSRRLKLHSRLLASKCGFNYHIHVHSKLKFVFARAAQLLKNIDISGVTLVVENNQTKCPISCYWLFIFSLISQNVITSLWYVHSNVTKVLSSLKMDDESWTPLLLKEPDLLMDRRASVFLVHCWICIECSLSFTITPAKKRTSRWTRQQSLPTSSAPQHNLIRRHSYWGSNTDKSSCAQCRKSLHRTSRGQWCAAMWQGREMLAW